MKLILLQKVVNLGDLGDQVDVKPGYGRNFLVPYGKAVPATANNLAKFEAKRAEYEAKAQAGPGRRPRPPGQAGRRQRSRCRQRLDRRQAVRFGRPARHRRGLHQAAGLQLDKREVVMGEGALRHTGEFDVDGAPARRRRVEASRSSWCRTPRKPGSRVATKRAPKGARFRWRSVRRSRDLRSRLSRIIHSVICKPSGGHRLR